MITSQILHDSLKENFGFEKFRTNQEEIINTILSGHDTLAITYRWGNQFAFNCQLSYFLELQ
jgi:superfamily II DNA helicase RecQ